MKRTLLFIILAISFSLAYSQGKPCCKNKSGKGKVACKLNQTNIDLNKDGFILDEEVQTTEISGVQCPNNSNVNLTDQKKCEGCKKAPWWKFWSKKKNCCNTKT